MNEDKLTRVADEIIKQFNVPGIWMSEASSGELLSVVCRGNSQLNPEIPANDNQFIPIGSATKAVVGFLTALLIDRDLKGQNAVGNEVRLKWDTKFGNIIDWGDDPNFSKIKDATIAQLLSHTSGLSEGPYNDVLTEQNPVKSRILFCKKCVLTKPNVGMPGEKMVYAPGSSFVAIMLEKLSGKNIEELLNDEIFKPLGLKYLRLGEPGYYSGDNFKKEDMPFGYYRKEDNSMHRVRGSERRIYPNLSFSASGACYGRINEWAILFSKIAMSKYRFSSLGLSRNFYGNAFVKESSISFFVRSGFEQIGEELFYHGGGLDRGQAAMYVDMKSRKSLSLFFNYAGGTSGNPFSKLIDYARFSILKR